MTATLPHLDRMADIASAYADAATFDAAAVPAWHALAEDSLRRADVLTHQYDVTVIDGDPYADAAAMFADLRTGHFSVTRANSDHPVWSVDVNVAFRIVHDIAGHYASGGDFSWRGENYACGAHAPRISPLAQRALFTECIAQTAYANVHGEFGPQKVVIL